jgi:hypothetical protein
MHTASEIGRRRLEDDVQVVGHDGESVNAPNTAKRGFAEVFLKPIAVDIIAYNVLSAIAAGHEVVDCARAREA